MRTSADRSNILNLTLKTLIISMNLDCFFSLEKVKNILEKFSN